VFDLFHAMPRAFAETQSRPKPKPRRRVKVRRAWLEIAVIVLLAGLAVAAVVALTAPSEARQPPSARGARF
jgi:hypothetical protein